MTTALFLSEGVYDLVFALMAYGVSGRASSVAATYAIGYAAEILVTLAGAGFLDYFDKRKLFARAQHLKIGLFASFVALGVVMPLSEPVIWGYAFAIDLAITIRGSRCSRWSPPCSTRASYPRSRVSTACSGGSRRWHPR